MEDDTKLRLSDAQLSHLVKQGSSVRGDRYEAVKVLGGGGPTTPQGVVIEVWQVNQGILSQVPPCVPNA